MTLTVLAVAYAHQSSLSPPLRLLLLDQGRIFFIFIFYFWGFVDGFLLPFRFPSHVFLFFFL